MSEESENRARLPQWLRSPEMLVALSAILLSLCGLFIAIYEASLFRQSQRASVWPHVQVGLSYAQDRVTIQVQNTGVGPARIEAGALYYKGERLRNWQELLRHFLPENADMAGFNQSLLNGTVLPTNSEPQYIFEITAGERDVAQALIHALGQAFFRGDIDITVCYSSVYEECWTTSLQDLLGRTRGGQASDNYGALRDCDSAQRSEI